jgi:flavin-dependent dehydrogenase
MDGSADDGDGLLVETFADGWWYTAALPHGRRVVACMTDADEARRLKLRDRDAFMRLLGETHHVRAAAAGGRVVDGPRLWPASSRCVTGRGDLPLLCAGDAASSFDPVSGQGIVKALRSGVFASYAVADWLKQGDARGIARYWSLITREFDAYRTTLRDYYLLEQRWADRPFWRRRHELAAPQDARVADAVAV